MKKPDSGTPLLTTDEREEAEQPSRTSSSNHDAYCPPPYKAPPQAKRSSSEESTGSNSPEAERLRPLYEREFTGEEALFGKDDHTKNQAPTPNKSKTRGS